VCNRKFRKSDDSIIKFMNISEINIYPIKSLGGISLDKSAVEERGLTFDRRWMLVNEQNQFLTQREFPVMSTIKISLVNKSLIADSGSSSVDIPYVPDSLETANVKIWSSSVKAKVYNGRTNKWFSEILKAGCRLVLMPEETKRKVNPFYAVRKFKDMVSFADGYPFMLIARSSLEDLNSRLKSPLPMNRFRPNFVVDESAAFAEDTWKLVKIGDTVFHVVKPCERCVITTVAQEVGEKAGKEPLKTLATYRTKNGKVLFGQNLIAEKAGGSIRIGDKVEVLD